MKIKRNTKHKCRSVWCMLLAFAMLIGWGTVGVPVLAQETEVPEGFTPIYTPEEFNNIRNDLDGNYILMNDITFQAEDFQDEYGWDPIGTDTDPFTGIFDGNKHTINGLYVNFRTSGYAGLFGYIENGIVENLGLCNSVIISENETPYGQCYVGGIVGGIRGGIIRNCYNADSVVSSYSLSYIGGIAGSAISSEIYSCYNTSNITFYRTNDVYYIGGIVGLFSGTIDRCYNVGDVTASTYEDASSWGGGIIGAITSNNGDEKNTISHCYNAGNVTCSSSRSSFFVGGILGGEGMFGAVSINDCYNSGNVNADSSGNARGYAGGIAGDIGDYGEQYDVIERCYNIGEVTSSSYEGAIVGRRIGHAEIINCYYLNNISAGVGSGSGDTVSCTYDEMTKQQTYTDFNFTDVWIMSSLEEYPFPILRVNSDIIYHAAVIANCHNTGVVEHWTYEQCPGKYFGDAACTIEIKEITTAIDPNNHDGGTVLKGAVDAGCETNGYTGDCCCAGCGAVLRAGTVITATGHKGVTTVEAQTPTCTETGKTEEIRCSVCDKILQASEPLAALGHSFTNYISDNNATCTENGTETAKCDRCDVTDTRIIDNSALGHDYSEEWTIDKEATCTESGSKSHHCTRCDEKTDITEIPAKGHSFVWVVDTPATEDAPGVQHEACTVCGDTRNENTEIPQLSHVHTGITHHQAVTATCRRPGTIEYWTCSSDKCAGKYYRDADCTTQITTITTAIDPNNHDGGTVLKGAVDAGCETNGYTGDCCCAGCGAVLRAGTVITATGHKGVTTVEAQTPTCTETGKTEEIRCSVCDKILQASEPLAALGHSFTNYISDNNATCTENGTETAKCDRCDATDTRTVPGSAQGHEFVKYIADGNAACEADGTATASCKRCGTTETIVIVGSALGHDMEERRTEPGFTFEGAVQNVCDRCGEMEINQILPKKKIETALTDVTSDQWFAYAIGYCLDYKLMQGTSYASDGRQIFLPDTSMTRAELVTVLYNMEGRPEVSYEAVFTDVTENQWFAPQIIWAYRQGIAAGTTKTTFAPDEAITREQIAAILYRYATDYLGLSMSAEDEDALLGAFSDAGEISDYARTAMAAMNQAGVITGDGDRLKPQENATRAEVASMLSRYLPNVLQADQTNGER